MSNDPASKGLSRRSALKRIGAGAAVVWTAPTLMTVGSRASAGSPAPCPASVHFPSNGETTGPNGTIIFSASCDVAGFDCTLDGLAVLCDTSGFFAFANLGHGAHTFTVRAHDALGQSGAPASVAWAVDTTGPTVVIT